MASDESNSSAAGEDRNAPITAASETRSSADQVEPTPAEQLAVPVAHSDETLSAAMKSADGDETSNEPTTSSTEISGTSSPQMMPLLTLKTAEESAKDVLVRPDSAINGSSKGAVTAAEEKRAADSALVVASQPAKPSKEMEAVKKDELLLVEQAAAKSSILPLVGSKRRSEEVDENAAEARTEDLTRPRLVQE